MATAAKLNDFRRRTGGSPAPSVPIKELPNSAETLAVFATTPERRAALKRQVEQNEEWRKSLSFSVGSSAVTARPAATLATVTAPAAPAAAGTTAPEPGPPGLDSTVPGPQGRPGLSEVLAVRCPDNGLVYRFVAREGDAGTSGEWQLYDGEPSLRFVPRTGDAALAGEWQPVSVRNPDDGLNYAYVPRLADDGKTVTGEWQAV